MRPPFNGRTSSCKLLRSLNKWKLIDLGQIAKVKIGVHLTVFHLITDGMMIASSSFGLWDPLPKSKNLIKNSENLMLKSRNGMTDTSLWT